MTEKRKRNFMSLLWTMDYSNYMVLWRIQDDGLTRQTSYTEREREREILTASRHVVVACLFIHRVNYLDVKLLLICNFDCTLSIMLPHGKRRMYIVYIALGPNQRCSLWLSVQCNVMQCSLIWDHRSLIESLMLWTINIERKRELAKTGQLLLYSHLK